ncbi:unnamed protein product [Spirodela intermedia]|uniref:Protein preY, mitochondrial n=2 Tax=Spirodela intermedia TaxID=51605 RepID=A0A7I8JAN8_SPIIN|nr:unnamed protein product [Spirodela intermedia]CAA6667051.1 unnamed protein product [Spirodela intermedia]CAA7403865.1 unnamed protein product [Spirodela intermedia]
MVKGSRALLCGGGGATNVSVIRQALCEFLVCPLSKQPLRYCEETRSLVSEAIGVSYPVVDGIPYLLPQEGKLLDGPQSPNPGDNSTDKSSSMTAG